MAENQEHVKLKEREIPVFTVLKNNCILKNIFVLDHPPPVSSVLGAGNGSQESEKEEILFVGRHPDCNIKLEHPSISRFHLRIHSSPSSRSLFVTDLSSVHGTFVSGKRIEPGVKIQLLKGDTLKLGESSRLYRLDWVPISFAYEINDSFVPQLDPLDTADEETEGTIDLDENSLPSEKEWGQHLSDKMEVLGVFMQEKATEAPIDEDLYSTFIERDEVENGPLPEMCNQRNEVSRSHLCTLDASFIVVEEREEVKYQVDVENLLKNGDTLLHRNEGMSPTEIVEDVERPFCEEDLALSMQKMSPTTLSLPEDDVENLSSHEICGKENEFSSSQLCEVEKETSPQVHISSAVLQKESQPEATEMNSERRRVLNIWSRRGKSESVKIETSRSKAICSSINMSSPVKLLLDEDCHSKSMLRDQFTSPDQDKEIFTPDKENASPKSSLVTSLGSKFDEALRSRSISNTTISSVDEDEEAFTSDKENKTPNGNLRRSFKNIGSSQEVKRSNLHKQSVLKTASQSICGEKAILSSLDCQGDQFASPDQDKEIFTPDKENASPKSCLVTSLGSKFDEALSRSISNTTISCVDEDEEAFTSDKENKTPNGNLLRSFKNIGSSQGEKHSNLHKRSLLKTVSNSICREEVMLPTLDCQQRTVLQEIKSTSASSKSHGRLRKQPNVVKSENREPFLPLPIVSANEHKVASIPSVEAASVNCSEFQKVNQAHRTASMATERSWTIVVDTACLLDKKSRREVQLLRGLRGTSLVIPRIVLRELDCMVRRASFLSRMTEASAALQWIEECMASTKWWIHVQSSAEESRLIPPTPPASSGHWFNDDRGPFSVGSIPFSPYTLQEIVTPTATDHILDTALFFKQLTTSGQLVLLSDDVTLKIKAMAEGVICETAKEFRASLVNPFSARFLYSDSSPRGPTWTCLDDTVLKEKYYPSPSKKTARSGEGAKGLKLILLHNSNFRQLKA